MADRWRIGILGLGHWYSAYELARALPEYPRAELTAVACAEAAPRDAFARTFGVDGHADADALLERDDVDVVLVASRVSEIPDAAVRAARAGKHLILGKPMAMTVEEAEGVAEVVRASGVTCVPFQAVARLRAAGLKARIDRGDVGDPVVLHQTARWSIAEDGFRSGRPGWFADPRHVPGGALIDEGIYGLDLFRWLTGSEVVRVEARTANLVHRELEVEDWGMACLTFANGVFATLEGAWTINAPRKTGPSPKQNSVVRLEVVGTRGEIVDQMFREPGRAILAAGAEDWIFERHAGDAFTPSVPQPLDHLLDCLETGEPPVATVDDALRGFRVAMAAYDAARAGRPVDLSW